MQIVCCAKMLCQTLAQHFRAKTLCRISALRFRAKKQCRTSALRFRSKTQCRTLAQHFRTKMLCWTSALHFRAKAGLPGDLENLEKPGKRQNYTIGPSKTLKNGQILPFQASGPKLYLALSFQLNLMMDQRIIPSSM